MKFVSTADLQHKTDATGETLVGDQKTFLIFNVWKSILISRMITQTIQVWIISRMIMQTTHADYSSLTQIGISKTLLLQTNVFTNDNYRENTPQKRKSEYNKRQMDVSV